jgi:hypothetical protein
MMPTPTLSPDRSVHRRPYVPAIVANPGRFCRACRVERAVIDRVLDHQRQGHCEACAEGGIEAMPPSGHATPPTVPPLQARETRPAPVVAAPLPSLAPDLAVYLGLALDHIEEYERHVGLHAARTTRAGGGSLQQVIAAAARIWFRNYPDMSRAEQGRAHTRALCILRDADKIAA